MRLRLGCDQQRVRKERGIVGFFGGFVFDGQTWISWDPDGSAPSVPQPWFSVMIHYSSVATIGYAPAGAGSGLAYLGTTPRVYFDDERASEPTDVVRESAALGRWRADLTQGLSGTADQWAALIRPFLAADDDPEPSEEDDLPDADIFVEIKTAQLLRALDLPLPDELDSFG